MRTSKAVTEMNWILNAKLYARVQFPLDKATSCFTVNTLPDHVEYILDLSVAITNAVARRLNTGALE